MVVARKIDKANPAMVNGYRSNCQRSCLSCSCKTWSCWRALKIVGSWSEFSETASIRVNKSGKPCAIWKESCSEFPDSRCLSALCSRNLLVGSLWERIRKRKQSLRGSTESASCFYWPVISASQATLSGFCSRAGSTGLICSWKNPWWCSCWCICSRPPASIRISSQGCPSLLVPCQKTCNLCMI